MSVSENQSQLICDFWKLNKAAISQATETETCLT